MKVFAISKRRSAGRWRSQQASGVLNIQPLYTRLQAPGPWRGRTGSQNAHPSGLLSLSRKLDRDSTKQGPSEDAQRWFTLTCKNNFRLFFKHGVSFFSFLAVLGLLHQHGLSSSCGEQRLLSGGGAQASRCSGFPCCRARALRHTSFSSCSSWALERRPNSCGA